MVSFGAAPVAGKYAGIPERSFIVFAPEGSSAAEAIERLAWRYGQESVLYVDSAGLAYLVFANGTRKGIGRWEPVEALRAAQLPAYTQTPDGRFWAAA